jgi:hypothetical protein
MMEIGHLLLGVILDTKLSTAGRGGVPMCHIFWVDAAHPEWYYESEVERIDATR